MDISRYTYLWEDKERWFLAEVEPNSYAIVGVGDNGEGLLVTIEDDDQCDAVMKKMIETGSNILTSEEEQELFRLNIFPDVDAKTEQKMVRELVQKIGLPDIQLDYHEDDIVIETDAELREMSKQAIQEMNAKYNLSDKKK